MSNGPATWTDGWQSRNFMNINDGPDLCLGLLPQMHIFSLSLLVPVKIDRCLFFVTDFGIVCLDRQPFYQHDITRSARAHDYAKSQTNQRQSRPNRQHCRWFGRLCRRFILTITKVNFCGKSLRHLTLSPECTGL